MARKQIVKSNGDIIPVQGAFVDDDINAVFPLDNPEPLVEVVAEGVRGSVAQTLEEQQRIIERAAEELGNFDLTPGAKSLLQRAMDNMMKNKGDGLLDPDAKFAVQCRAELIEAADGDLAITIDAIASAAAPSDVAGEIYSLLYNVLKSATFIANMDYRRALDPNSDFDLTIYAPDGFKSRGEDGRDVRDQDHAEFYVDSREDTSPMEGITGHATKLEWQMDALQELYGNGFTEIEDAVICSLRDLQLFFQLTVESFGWDSTRVIPYAFNMELDGSFTPITDPTTALDAQEIKRQVARAKKRDKLNNMRVAAAAIAKQRVAAALSKR